MSEREALVEAVVERVMAALRRPDQACPDCTGGCAACCSDKVRETVGAGATRISYHGDGGKVPADLAPFIDHTLLKPDATAEDIDRYCEEAKRYGFAAVCFNPVWVKRAAQNLRGSPVKVASVVGLPAGRPDRRGQGARGPARAARRGARDRHGDQRRGAQERRPGAGARRHRARREACREAGACAR